ncbi:hypothetical protein ACQJBY_025264 [Aegilops geniculata]
MASCINGTLRHDDDLDVRHPQPHRLPLLRLSRSLAGVVLRDGNWPGEGIQPGEACCNRPVRKLEPANQFAGTGDDKSYKGVRCATTRLVFAGTSTPICWNQRNEVLQPWPARPAGDESAPGRAATITAGAVTSRNRFGAVCAVLLEPADGEAATGLARSCNHISSVLETNNNRFVFVGTWNPFCPRSPLATICASTMGDWNLLRATTSDINGGGVAGREAQRR